MKGSSVSLFKSKLFRFGLLIAFAVAAILIVLAMMLGNEAGQFVIRVQSGNAERSIAITEDLDDETQYTSRLSVPGITDMGDYSPKHFLEKDYKTLDELTQKMGVQNIDRGSLYVYTFYIKNTSEKGSVSVNVKLEYSHVTNYLDEVIRVLTYTTGYGIYDPNVYQKEDDIQKLSKVFDGLTRVEYPEYILQPTNFSDTSRSSAGTVFDNQSFVIGDATSGQDYAKYSIFFWIEGNDPDSDYYNEALYNGTIRFNLTLTVGM